MTGAPAANSSADTPAAVNSSPRKRKAATDLPSSATKQTKRGTYTCFVACGNIQCILNTVTAYYADFTVTPSTTRTYSLYVICLLRSRMETVTSHCFAVCMIMIDMCSTEHSAASDAMETLEQHQQEQVGS